MQIAWEYTRILIILMVRQRKMNSKGNVSCTSNWLCCEVVYFWYVCSLAALRRKNATGILSTRPKLRPQGQYIVIQVDSKLVSEHLSFYFFVNITYLLWNCPALMRWNNSEAIRHLFLHYNLIREDSKWFERLTNGEVGRMVRVYSWNRCSLAYRFRIRTKSLRKFASVLAIFSAKDAVCVRYMHGC